MTIAKILDGHERIALYFSGGKDSLACLLLLADHWDRFDVVWINPGAPEPETVAYMQAIRAMVPRFIELRGDQPAWIRAHGWPADVVPMRRTALGEVGAGPSPVRFQSYLDCCGANLWGPLRKHLLESGVTLAITGQRRAEPLRNRLRDEELQDIGGVTFWQPINGWSTDDVTRFIKACGHDLPPFYDQGAESSADCWNCTAYLDHNRGRLAAMKRNAPHQYQVIEPVLRNLAEALHAESLPLFQILED